MANLENQKCPIKQIQKNFILENSEKCRFKNFQFRAFQKFPILSIFENHQIFIIQFQRITNFQNFTMWKTIKIRKFSIL